MLRPRPNQRRSLFKNRKSSTLETLEARLLLTSDLQPLLDINTAGSSNEISEVAKFGDEVFFGSSSRHDGYQLWKTDGSLESTRLVKDFAPGTYDTVRDFTEHEGALYFLASNEGVPHGLWKTDGTEAGTVLVKDQADENTLIAVGESLYFASEGQLWKTDGSENGTIRLLEDELRPRGPFVYRDSLYFLGAERLWTSDGTAAGTQPVSDVPAYTTTPVVSNDRIFFYGEDSVHGRELWTTDGTAAGTQLVKDIRAGTADSSVTSLVDVNGKVFFFALDDVHGYELWTSDGTSDGTHLVKDVNNIGNRGIFEENQSLVRFGDNVLFGALGELWKSDGTEAGTASVTDLPFPSSFSPGPENLTVIGDTTYFSLNTFGDGGLGRELWQTDGTSAGTTLVKDIYPGIGSSNPWSFTEVDGELFFGAYDGLRGRDLWKSDGTESGTQRISDAPKTTEGSAPRFLTSQGDTAFFFAREASGQRHLWKSDGTTDGTEIVKDSVSEDFSRYPLAATVGEQIFFVASDDSGDSLWETDGTTAGTVVVKSFGDSLDFEEMVSAGDQVFLLTSDRLWVSDGTEEGTVQLEADIGSFFSGFPSRPVGFQGEVYFRTYANDIWKSDGTEAGTTILKSLPGSLGQDRSFKVVGDSLYFTILNDSPIDELWKTDGTEAGTQLVTDLGSPHQFTEFDGKLFFFSVTDGYYSLGVSDGSDSGTQILKDIIPDGGHGSPLSDLLVAGDELFFTVQQRVQDQFFVELWRSDGTPDGTRQVGRTPDGTLGVSRSSGVSNGMPYFLTTQSTGPSASRLWGFSDAQEVSQVFQIGGPTSVENFLFAANTIFASIDSDRYGSEVHAVNVGQGRPSIEVNDNVVIAVGTDGDDDFELHLGFEKHVLTINRQPYEFDAGEIDTFHLGAGATAANDKIRVIGTELDDTATAFGNRGVIRSDAYEVNTYTFDSLIFDGDNGNDRAQIYGSVEFDTLEGLPGDTTMETPAHTFRMIDFERVDSYGRGGGDRAQVYGTVEADDFYTWDGFEVLQGPGHYQVTKGFSRVDAYGRAGNDTGHLFDTVGDDHMYSFATYVVMQSPTTKSVAKGFEWVETAANRGGYDNAYLWQVGDNEHIFASGVRALVDGPTRFVIADNFDQVDVRILDGANPTTDIGDIDFLLTGISQGSGEPALAASQTAEQIFAGDTNFDGVVDFTDFLVVSFNFGKNDRIYLWEDGDSNGDGIVDFVDFLALSENFRVNA